MEWECHTYVVWECDTRWNGNPMGSYHGDETIPYHVESYHTREMEPYHTMWNHTIPGHTMEMEPYHTMWNHTIADHTMKMESWSHTIPWEWNLCRSSTKLGKVE